MASLDQAFFLTHRTSQEDSVRIFFVRGFGFQITDNILSESNTSLLTPTTFFDDLTKVKAWFGGVRESLLQRCVILYRPDHLFFISSLITFYIKLRGINILIITANGDP